MPIDSTWGLPASEVTGRRRTAPAATERRP